jgi:hypothetical protein
MNIAVFNEDEDAFNMGLERLEKRNPSYFYLESDGGVPSINGDGGNIQNFWSNPTLWVDGLTQETCKDNNHHAQFAMASALHAAEVAWNQGVDVYTDNTERYTATMELLATQILSGKMQGTCANNETNVEYIDTWEIGFNHYHNRKGVYLPNTEKLIFEQVRPKGWSALNIFYETLTHAGDYTPTSNSNQLSQITEISVYPSPSNDGFFKISKEVLWKVYTITGIMIGEGYGNTINLSAQSRGLYMIKAENNVMKVIID